MTYEVKKCKVVYYKAVRCNFYLEYMCSNFKLLLCVWGSYNVNSYPLYSIPFPPANYQHAPIRFTTCVQCPDQFGCMRYKNSTVQPRLSEQICSWAHSDK